MKTKVDLSLLFLCLALIAQKGFGSYFLGDDTLIEAKIKETEKRAEQ